MTKSRPFLGLLALNLGGLDRLYPRVTIETLPDNVLLEIFEFYLGKDDADEIDSGHDYDRWQTLVHVCCRWRCIVFASPRRLDLKLYCTRQRSVNLKTLDIWPALPIVIYAPGIHFKEDVTNAIAALKQPSRVCKISYRHWQFQDPSHLLEEFATIDKPFPALTSLELSTFQNVPVFPDSFLGGYAPRLRSLHLDGIPYPSIGKLLSSTTNLVRLSLLYIPHSGYIAPEIIVPCLSMLPKLKLLELGFRHPRSQTHRANRHPPPLTRVIFPNLTSIRFHGDIEYLEDILCQIETPILNKTYFHFFNQLVFDTPLLGYFIGHTGAFTTIHKACVQFRGWTIQVILLGQEEMAAVINNNRKVLDLKICCEGLDWQVSAVAQVLNSFSSSLPALETLEVVVSREDWQGKIEVVQWREFLHSFTFVKTMTLESEHPVRLIAPALQEFARERATNVLPALQNLFLRAYSSRASGPLKTAIEQFIAARQFCGQPVTVHY